MTCSVDGCGRPSAARGMCKVHHSAWRRAQPDFPRCRVDGCGRPRQAKGLCSTHYRRLRQTGDADENTPVRPHLAWPWSLLGRLVFMPPGPMPTGCIEHVGTRNHAGYGEVHFKGRSRLAHRVAYQWMVGPIPEGLELDHVCRNRACVNPGHLRPVTHLENMQNAERWQLRKTHCPNGHPYDEANTYRQPSGNVRRCRACLRDKWQRDKDSREARR